MAISPTAEGFRAAFRRPAFSLAEVMWRWSAGGTAAVLLAFGFFEFLDTLPVTKGETLFLRTRHPYLVAQALAHIFRGSLNRAVMGALIGAIMLAVVWVIAASVGRIATVRALLEYFAGNTRLKFQPAGGVDSGEGKIANNRSLETWSPFPALLRLNFLRVATLLAVVIGFVGASILAGFASPDAHPRPGLAFLIFMPFAALVTLVGWALNWLLSLSGMFAVRDGEEAVASIAAAVHFCRQRTGAVFAVGTWTGLAHLVLFVGATTAVSVPLGLAGALPWRLVVLGIILVTLGYFALADWLYIARLAGYMCIAETPEELLKPAPPALPTPIPRPLMTTIDRDEPILSDVPGLA